MKTELVVLIYLVPKGDQKITVGAVAIDPVESAESTKSLENNDCKVSIVDVTKENVSPTETVESVETTEPVESTESAETSVNNDVLKTSETFHRRYYYYPRTYYYPRYHDPQYYRQPVASGYYNRYQPQHNRPQQSLIANPTNRYPYNQPSSSPVYYTQPTTSSYAQYSYDSGSSSDGVGSLEWLESPPDNGPCGRKRRSRSKRCFSCRRKRGSRSKRCVGGWR